MTKKEKELEHYIKQLCKQADVIYDPDFGTHWEDEKFNELFKEDLQRQLDYMVAEGLCAKVGDKYIYRENPADL